jgi:hypothetical protein
MRRTLLVLLTLGVGLATLSVSTNNVQAKAKRLPTVTTYSTNDNKVKFKFTSQVTKSVSATKTYDLYDGKVTLRLKGLRYYTLKPKYGKKLLVRAYFKATSNLDGSEDVFEDYDDGDGTYLNTTDGDRLYQIGTKNGSDTGVVALSGHDAANIHVDYMSSHAVPLGNFGSGTIHFVLSEENHELQFQ